MRILYKIASVSIEFDKGILEVVAADPEISVDQNIITLNSAGLNGSSRSITVKTTPEVTKEALEKLIQEQKEHQEKITPQAAGKSTAKH